MKKGQKKNQEKSSTREKILFWIAIGNFILTLIDKLISWFN